MIDIKISLSIVLPGSKMVSQEECLTTTQKVWKDKSGKKHSKKTVVENHDLMDIHSFVIKGDKKKGESTERIVYYTRKCVPARQNLNICTEAYNNMIDADSCPEWSKIFIWKKMSKEQRLSAHMERIAESFGGKVLEYTVFED